MAEEALLTSLRVLDLSSGDGDGVGRILADLGADVLKIEPPGGAPSRSMPPTVAGVSIPFTLNNANKRCAQLDPAIAGDRDRLLELAAGSDVVVVESGNSSTANLFGTSCHELAATFDHLVVLSVTDFGTDGPRASWRATDSVFYAMSSALSRTGPTSGTPVLPPDGLASGTAAVQAAWAVLVAYYDRLRCGKGEFIDFSRYEAVVQALDPPFGSEGQAATGLKSPAELWRGRPRNQQIYPIFECKDGHVRICLLSPRQWRGMWAWLGEPAQFAGPEFETIAARYAASRELNAAMAELFATQTMVDLVAQGQARGVPVAAVLTPVEALSASHFREVDAIRDETLAPGATVAIPIGPLVVDGVHRGYRQAPPAAGTDSPDWLQRPTEVVAHEDVFRPLDGLRILDLGVIVAGGELGRLFADLGAEVIKVESPAYPDGLRQTPPGGLVSRSWVLTHRNEESLGLDLRNPAGAELFSRLVESADAVFANFKPGTLAALGFSYERLRSLNPRIVLAESSAFGDRGPWSAQMGYGPLVRASTGVTRLWTSQDAEPGAFYDATTIFPDHVVGRLTAIAALAVLIRRKLAPDCGGHVHISQAEAAITQLATVYAAESARAAGLSVETGASALDAVFPCTGDDEWCVISLRSPSHRADLAGLLGRPDLPVDRAELIAAVTDWTSTRDKDEVAESLQRVGVPAGPMLRAADVAADPQVVFRKLFTTMAHPLLERPIPAETAPALFARIPRADLRPAPMAGEHTREICRRLLGLSAAEVDDLINDGALFAYEKKN